MCSSDLAYNGPLSTALAVWAWLTVNRTLPAITSSLGSLGVPVVGLVASVVALGEPLDVASVTGLVFIVAGVALASLEPSTRGNRTSVKPATVEGR